YKPLTTRDVHWTRVDSTPAGTPWAELIKFCIARTKYSTDCIGILLREVSAQFSGMHTVLYLLVFGILFPWLARVRFRFAIPKPLSLNYYLGKNMRKLFLHTFRRYAATLAEFNQCAPRTSITAHTEQLRNMSSVLHKFVSYPVGDFDRFISPFLKTELVEELATFGDYSLLLRRPSLSIVKDLLRIRELQTQPSGDTSVSGDLNLQSHAVPRFVTYGQPGTGISVTLAQISHFAATNNWLVFPFPDAERWLYRCVDLTPSNEYHQDQHKPNLVGDAFDYPSRSANWLQGFVKMNEGFLEKYKPLTTRDVHWTRVDSTPAGTPWAELIKFCIARTKYSTDCIGILLREVSAQFSGMHTVLYLL
ncbi:hypothetical protein X801_08505, partial [Opisthorchis viverrini]